MFQWYQLSGWSPNDGSLCVGHFSPKPTFLPSMTQMKRPSFSGSGADSDWQPHTYLLWLASDEYIGVVGGGTMFSKVNALSSLLTNSTSLATSTSSPEMSTWFTHQFGI